jgi:hypothetical protein
MLGKEYRLWNQSPRLHKISHATDTLRCLGSGIHLSTLFSNSQSHVTTDDQSVSPSWCRGPSGSHDRILISVWHLVFMSMSGAPSDERPGLSSVLVTWTASVQEYCCWPLSATLSRTAFGLPSSHRRGTSPPTTLAVHGESLEFCGLSWYLNVSKIIQCFMRFTAWTTAKIHISVFCVMMPRRLPTAEPRVRSQIRSCGIYGGESGNDAGFLRIFRFPLVLIPPTVPYSLIMLSPR